MRLLGRLSASRPLVCLQLIMSNELIALLAIQFTLIIFGAGGLWIKVADIAERVKRIEAWINGTRNEQGRDLDGKS